VEPVAYLCDSTVEIPVILPGVQETVKAALWRYGFNFRRSGDHQGSTVETLVTLPGVPEIVKETLWRYWFHFRRSGGHQGNTVEIRVTLPAFRRSSRQHCGDTGYIAGVPEIVKVTLWRYWLHCRRSGDRQGKGLEDGDSKDLREYRHYPEIESI
jgi:hypothetical protein